VNMANGMRERLEVSIGIPKGGWLAQRRN